MLAGSDSREFCEAKLFVEFIGPVIRASHGKVNTGRAPASQSIEQSVHHARAISDSLGVREQVDVQVGRIRVERIGVEEIGAVIAVIHPLRGRPVGRITLGLGMDFLQIGEPIRQTSCVESLRIPSAQGVAANARRVRQNEGEFGFQAHVGSHEKMPERLGVGVKVRGVAARIAGLQANGIDRRFISGLERPNRELIWVHCKR